MEMWDTHLSGGEIPAEITKLSAASPSEKNNNKKLDR